MPNSYSRQVQSRVVIEHIQRIFNTMSEALKKKLIEECKRLDASYNPPLNHSIDEVRSDFKLIKSVHEKKRKREVLIEEYKRLDASYNPPLNHSFNNIRSDLKLINLQKRKKMHSRCGLVNLGASCFLNAVL